MAGPPHAQSPLFPSHLLLPLSSTVGLSLLEADFNAQVSITQTYGWLLTSTTAFKCKTNTFTRKSNFDRIIFVLNNLPLSFIANDNREDDPFVFNWQESMRNKFRIFIPLKTA